jgi:hypothetical protein
MFAQWTWAHLASVFACTTVEGTDLASEVSFGVGSASPCGCSTTGEGAALASVRAFSVGSDSHCGGGHDS